MERLLLFLAVVEAVSGHGRMIEPPQRSSVWRFYPGDDRFTPNYNDNELFCGGFQNQVQNGGKCGTCGDPYDGVRENEAGGKYATGFITRNYTQGQVIDVTIDLTTSHLGSFQFKICPHNDVTKAVSPSCLDQNILAFTNGEYKWPVSATGFYNLELQLPPGMTCEQCVLQWHYTAGNNWGIDSVTGEGCLGCGDQETFINCADIGIYGSGVTLPPQPTTPNPTPGATTSCSTHPPITTPMPTSCPVGYILRCQGKNVSDRYCAWHCRFHAGSCDPSLCSCSCVPDISCRGVGSLDNKPYADQYCYYNCIDGCSHLDHECQCSS